VRGTYVEFARSMAKIEKEVWLNQDLVRVVKAMSLER
jgi:hypothetical protein